MLEMEARQWVSTVIRNKPACAEVDLKASLPHFAHITQSTLFVSGLTGLFFCRIIWPFSTDEETLKIMELCGWGTLKYRLPIELILKLVMPRIT